jgi:sugar phosphate permease
LLNRRSREGVTISILGILILLFEPVGAAGSCSDFGGGCSNLSANSWWGFIHWPAGWDEFFLPMMMIGIALIVAGVLTLIKARRPKPRNGPTLRG